MEKAEAFALLGVALSFCNLHCAASRTGPDPRWGIHDMNRPAPPVITPCPPEPQMPPPSDAVVLFKDDLSGWTDEKGNPAKWKTENGYVEVIPKTGSIQTKQRFGDCQLHVEWAVPAKVSGDGQERGNSGVFLMTRYEVQVLDCFENKTYADGMTAAVYGQYPPLVNACRKPGEWQTFDILFHAPRFNRSGSLRLPARMTVFHNGVLVQDNVELSGPTAHKIRPPYAAHADKLPLLLQDHRCPVRFQNVWVRELPDPSRP